MDYLLFWIVSNYVVVPQHGPLPLYSKLEGPIDCKLNFLIFFMVWPLDNFQGALDFHGHNTWFMRKAALNMGR